MDGVMTFSTRMLGLWVECDGLKWKRGSQWLFLPDRYEREGSVGWLIGRSVLIHFGRLSGCNVYVRCVDQIRLLLYSIEIVCFPIQSVL
jgi:hypothetical protein